MTCRWLSAGALGVVTAAAVGAAALGALVACSEGARGGSGSGSAGAGSGASKRTLGAAASSGAGQAAHAFLAKPRRGFRPAPAWADPPRFNAKRPMGLRVLPDGDLGEWGGAKISWQKGKPVAKASGYSGDGDLSASLAISSYRGGLSVALRVRDDHHRPAAAAPALAKHDHVRLELWPLPGGTRTKKVPESVREHLGVALRLGTRNRLVSFEKPRQPWRDKAASSMGVVVAGGYSLEARLPLKTLTPVAGGIIDRVRYRVTIYDSDARKERAVPTLRFEGTAKLTVPMEVPEAVQKRASARACLAAEPGGMWGFRYAWRCVVPRGRAGLGADDRGKPQLAFGYHRYPKPPRLQWLREKMIFVNLTGVRRGIAALLDRHGKLLSLLRLGIIGASDPGNPRTHESGARPIKLPDGTWAVAAVHAHPAKVGPLGARCASGHRVFVSIIAARGAPESNPHNPAPEPATPPVLEEVFRALLMDCRGKRAYAWKLSKDRRVIRVRDTVFPTRDVKTFVYRGGWYQRADDDGGDKAKGGGMGARRRGGKPRAGGGKR